MEAGFSLSCVIPAYNEQETVGNVVRAVASCSIISEVIVVDNGSTDRTAHEAEIAGAVVIRELRQGMGYALQAGFRMARGRLIFKTDADILNFNPHWINIMHARHLECRAILTRAVFDTEGEEFPVTNLVVLPLIEILRPDWLPIRRPLSGTYLVDRDCIQFDKCPTGWAFDLSVYINARRQKCQIEEVDLGVLNDKIRPIHYYQPVARELMHFLLGELSIPSV